MKSSAVRAVGVFAAVAAASLAHAQTTLAVEWKVSEGGNGHWYRFDQSVLHWQPHRDRAVAQGAYLATVTSSAEKSFVESLLFLQENDIWLGGQSNWPLPITWVTGEPFTYTPSFWCSNDGYNPGGGYAIEICGRSNCLGRFCWSIESENGLGWPGNKAVYEWEADCNADGKVDYGQILRGELDDDNTNGIPDVCETSVSGVIPPSVPAQGGATVTIKGANFPENPTVLIGGLPATNVVRLSATRITATSPALLPGMTSISVNGFTLPEALYIRPECGSDLDQDGVVGAGDIAIVLLDFGDCVTTQAAPTEPLIFERPESSAAPTPAAPAAP